MEILNRPRRLRKTESIRQMATETRLFVDELIYPLFIVEGTGVKEEIKSLPDVYHFSVDRLADEVEELLSLGVKHVLLFGVVDPKEKDDVGSIGCSVDGVVACAVREIKRLAPEMTVITDVCLCEYTSHGHCGQLTESGEVDNDKTLSLLTEMAISHAAAGADMVAPSDMMDGRVLALRKGLDAAGFTDVGILSYSVKYASSYYGPFREAAGSAPSFGDRKSYQMNPANVREALREAELDVAEGADMLMVKPALAYLDVIHRVKAGTHLPVVAYNVSGEYAMLKMAMAQNIMNESVMMETMTSIKRAGADVIITYFAKDIARQLRGL